MKQSLLVFLACIIALGLAGCVSAHSPAQTIGSGAAGDGEVIKIICPYGVGGTADATARRYAQVANRLYPEYHFTVENLTGGDGLLAAAYYAQLEPSTKELLMLGYGVAYRHDLGEKFGTEVVDFDRGEIYPVATIDDRTWIVYARPGTTLEDILGQARDGNVKMSGGNPLSDPHLALGSLVAQEGGSLMVVPYDGGANQKQGLRDGEVDVFVGTTQAAQEEVAAGSLIPLLAFSDHCFEGFVTPEGPISVPGVAGTSKAPALDVSVDYSSCILPAGGFLATRTGADPIWVDQLIQISKDVWDDPEYCDWIGEILLNRFEVYGEEANRFLEDACGKAIEAYKTLQRTL